MLTPPSPCRLLAAMLTYSTKAADAAIAACNKDVLPRVFGMATEVSVLCTLKSEVWVHACVCLRRAHLDYCERADLA